MAESNAASSDSEPLVINAGDYEDLPEPIAQGPGGRPLDKKLLSLAIRCYKRDDPSKANMFRCAGTDTGCTTAWKSKNRVKRRILVHAATCEHLPRKLREKLDGGLAMVAPSMKSAALNLNVAAPTNKSAVLNLNVAAPVGLSTSTVTAPINKSQPSVAPLAKKARIEALKAQLDADVVQLFCVGGLPPSKADLPEWKTMWLHAVPSYSPVSSSNLTEYQIPAEAALVRTKQLEHLRTCINLSITFDGQTTRLPESVYTIHVITPDRLVFFFEGNEASEVSHSADHLFCILDVVHGTVLNVPGNIAELNTMQVIITIGATRFSGICSDDTGNTRLARKKVQKKYPWILNTPDPCHRMNLLVKDICVISFFQPAIKTCRRVIKFFKKSTHANSHLRIARKTFKVTRGLVSIGKTRFGTMYFSGASVQRCLPAIRDLCRNQIVKIPV